MATQHHARLTEDFTATADVLRRSTVHVRSGQWGAGSGVIWNPDGLVVTNAHVARTQSMSVELSDGRRFDAGLIAADPRRDLAALRIKASGLPAVPVGDSDTLRVGQLVVALGNPLGLSGALTVGIVHAIAPTEPGRQTWVQADVRLAPGNSGGPLADVQGRIVGINSMVSGGLGLAVPSNEVTRFLQSGKERPYLGVVLQPVTVTLDRGKQTGTLILEIQTDSPAEAAGLLVGDVLVGAGGRLFADPRDLEAAVAVAGAGVPILFDLLRGGVRLQREIIPGKSVATRREDDRIGSEEAA
jgi:serine protease Do